MKFTQLLTQILLLIAIQLSIGCDHSKQNRKISESAKETQRDEAAKKIDDFVYDGPVFLKNKTLAEVRKLGVLKSEKITFEENPHVENDKIEFRTFEFEGLEISGIVDKDSFSAISITVSDSRWPILYDLRVGSSATRVPSALGQSPRAMNGPIEEFSGDTETVKFTVSKGKIMKIEFIYYYD